MPTKSPTPIKRPTGFFLVFFYIVCAGISAAMITAGVSLKSDLFVATGLLGVVIVLAVGPIVYILGRRFATGIDERLFEELTAIRRSIDEGQEFQALSDDARRALNRKRERELLIRAIEEDITGEDWDAAMILIHELAERFGYRADAETFRQRIDSARAETLERKVRDAVAILDGFIIQRRWDEATLEAARIRRLYPDSPRTAALADRVSKARSAYKVDLERRFQLAAKEQRAEDAMALLKELDQYLTPEEAHAHRETARDVIAKVRDQLGAEFKLAVQDRRWKKAAELGDRIVEQFPNSRMAEEVRGMLEGLRQKSASGS
jgi:hypothetical protein